MTNMQDKGVAGGADVNFNDMLIFSAKVWKVHAEELTMEGVASNVDEKAFLRMHKLDIQGVGSQKETLNLESNASRVAWVQDTTVDRHQQIRFVHDTALAEVSFAWEAVGEGVVNATLTVAPHHSYPLSAVMLRASFVTQLCEIGCTTCPRPHGARCLTQPTLVRHLGTFFTWNSVAKINGGSCSVAVGEELMCDSDSLLDSSVSTVDFVFGCGANNHIHSSLVWNFAIGIEGATFGKVLDGTQDREQCGEPSSKLALSRISNRNSAGHDASSGEHSADTGASVALAVVLPVLGIIFVALAAWFFRRRVLARRLSQGSMMMEDESQAAEEKDAEADHVFGRPMQALPDSTTSMVEHVSDDESETRL